MVKVKVNSKGKWDVLENNSKEGMYIDGYLMKNLDNVINNVKKHDFDSFIIIGGREGFGKSTLAAQLATYLDPTYNLDRCTFTANQFKEACESANKYEAIVFDETMGYLSSRGAMSKFNRELIKIMSEMRSKNLFVIMCIPNYFELDKYPAIHRSTAFINVYKRSFFGSYDYNQKKLLYLTGKKYYSYKVKANFIGKFTKYFPLDQIAYENKKQKSIREWDKESDKHKRVANKLNSLIYHIYDENLMKTTEIAEIVGYTQRWVQFVIENQTNERMKVLQA